MRKLALSDEILLKISQPARYIGGEVNMVKKDPSKVAVRFASAFRMCMRSVCPIWASRFFMICSTAGMTFTVSAFIPVDGLRSDHHAGAEDPAVCR